jgi:hypothetical protein
MRGLVWCAAHTVTWRVCSSTGFQPVVGGCSATPGECLSAWVCAGGGGGYLPHMCLLGGEVLKQKTRLDFWGQNSQSLCVWLGEGGCSKPPPGWQTELSLSSFNGLTLPHSLNTHSCCCCYCCCCCCCCCCCSVHWRAHRAHPERQVAYLMCQHSSGGRLPYRLQQQP